MEDLISRISAMDVDQLINLPIEDAERIAARPDLIPLLLAMTNQCGRTAGLKRAQSEFDIRKHKMSRARTTPV